MKSIASILLRATAWQVFLFVAGLVPAVIAMRLLLSKADDVVRIPFGLAVGTELVFICVSLWLWSLGTFLDSVVRPSLRPSRRFFYVSLIFPVVYLPLFEVRVPHVMTHPVEFALIFLVHFFAVFCGFYSYYFVSKCLALAEKNRPVSYSDYRGYFLGFWFFPAGVWFTQPRINRLLRKDRGSFGRHVVREQLLAHSDDRLGGPIFVGSLRERWGFCRR